jgi:hypothetical protein
LWRFCQENPLERADISATARATQRDVEHLGRQWSILQSRAERTAALEREIRTLRETVEPRPSGQDDTTSTPRPRDSATESLAGAAVRDSESSRPTDHRRGAMSNALARMRPRRAPQPAAVADGEQQLAMPVILISFNRGSMLRRAVDAYRRQSIPVDIYIHDNGSDDPHTIDVLLELERDGATVFRRPAITSPDDLNLVDETVQEVFRNRRPAPYAVSDCDVSLDESSTETLAAYVDLLDAMPDLECVGPMLRIDDVPTSYPLYVAMMNRHIKAFWAKEPRWAVAQGRLVAYQRAPIDTTLAVHRAGAPFERLRKGARLYHPFAARHLDWYPAEHESAYRSSTDGSTISNWSNPARERANRHVELERTRYRDVKDTEDGGLVAFTRTAREPGQG